MASRVAAEDQAEALRRAALRETDELLAAVVDELPPGTMLVVMGVTPPTGTWELTPVVASGAGVTPGALHSLSTKRAGLVTMPDVTATIIDALGQPVPDGVIGSPLEHRTGDVSISRLQEANDVAVSRERIYFPMSLTFIIAQSIFYLLLVAVFALTGAPRPLRTAIRLAVLTFAAWPLATYLVRIWPYLMTLGHLTHLAVWIVSLGVALLASRLRRHPLAPLGAICLATAVLLLVDVSTGARLQSASILGYSPHTSTRFFGFGNTAYAVLAPCALVAAVLHVERSPNRREAVALSAIFLAVVVIADGAPWLGSDIGGILSLVPVFGLTLAVLAGRRLSVRTVLVAAAGTLLVLALAVGADVLRPESSRTHLANFVLDSRDGGTFWTTISRKWSANLRVFRQSYWTWTVPVIAIGAGYLLVTARRSRELLPDGSPLRTGVIGVLSVGVIGWLVNDSGIVVTALALVYALPFLVLLAIEQPWSWRESRR
jgi:hypothetical protein